MDSINAYTSVVCRLSFQQLNLYYLFIYGDTLVASYFLCASSATEVLGMERNSVGNATWISGT